MQDRTIDNGASRASAPATASIGTMKAQRPGSIAMPCKVVSSERPAVQPRRPGRCARWRMTRRGDLRQPVRPRILHVLQRGRHTGRERARDKDADGHRQEGENRQRHLARLDLLPQDLQVCDPPSGQPETPPARRPGASPQKAHADAAGGDLAPPARWRASQGPDSGVQVNARESRRRQEARARSAWPPRLREGRRSLRPRRASRRSGRPACARGPAPTSRGRSRRGRRVPSS